MERVHTCAIINDGQIESFLESVYSKAIDVLEANIRRIAGSSRNLVAPASNTQGANLFLKEVTSRAICTFSHRLSKLLSSGHFQFGLLRDDYVGPTPPMVYRYMLDGNDDSLLNTETREDIQSGWPLTSDEECHNKCKGSIKTQQMQQDDSGKAFLKVEAVQGLGKTIPSPPDPETNKQNGQDTEPTILVSVSHPNSDVASYVDSEEPDIPDLKDPTPQEAKTTDNCKFTGFHPARNLLQCGVCEEQVVDTCAKKQFDSSINEFALKSTVTVPSETRFDTNSSESLEGRHEGLEHNLSRKFSQQESFDGPVGYGEEGLEICSEMNEEYSTIAREMKTDKDQEVPDSHLVHPVDESSRFYSLEKMKDEDEVTLDVSSCAEALRCHWFTSPVKEMPDMDSSKENLQKLPSIPACNRRRRVGLSRKQKVPPLHTKRLKLSEQ